MLYFKILLAFLSKTVDCSFDFCPVTSINIVSAVQSELYRLLCLRYCVMRELEL